MASGAAAGGTQLRDVGSCGWRVSRQAVTACLWPQCPCESEFSVLLARRILQAWSSHLARAARRDTHGLWPEERSHVGMRSLLRLAVGDRRVDIARIVD